MKPFHEWVSDMAGTIEDNSVVTNKKKNSTELREKEIKESPKYYLYDEWKMEDED